MLHVIGLVAYSLPIHYSDPELLLDKQVLIVLMFLNIKRHVEYALICP